MKRFLLYITQNYSFAILRPLQQAIRARGDEAAWFVEGDQVNTSYLKADEKRLHSIAEIKAYQPDAVLVPGNMVPGFIPGLKVAVFHGFNAGKRQDHIGHFAIRNCFDLYCTQGPSTTGPFEQLAAEHGFFRIVETGWPAVDPLYAPVAEAENQPRPVVLMCSTFTQKLSCAPHLLETVRRLSRDGKWQWLIQFHPKMPADIVASYKALENDNLRFVETDNVIPLLQQADVMVCDTSSVLLMFLLLNKPVVTFRNSSPGPHLLNIESADLLEDSITQALAHPPALMSAIGDFITRLHPYHDGRSAERVLDAVDKTLAGELPVNKRRPLNLFRNLRARKRLNYWAL